MIGLALCVLAFVAAFTEGRRSVGRGLAAVLAAGYGYGILRANFPSIFAHFIFDAAVVGLYAALFSQRLTRTGRARLSTVLPWFAALGIWSVLMFLVPNQDYLVQLVGLRAAIFLLPLLLVGTLLQRPDFDHLARAVAVLNLLVVGVAILEYLFGLEPFFPRGPTTITIYGASDVAGGRHRIPAPFPSAHHFGGALVASLPFVVIRLLREDLRAQERRLLIAGLVASVLGILICGARTPVAHAAVIGLLFLALARIPARYKRGLVFVAVVAAVVALSDPRMQRALTLGNPELVSKRLGKALDVSLLDVIVDHPLGSGMGSAWGTSTPHFLADRVTLRLGAENELVRIALELGLPGLAIWICLTAWVLTRRPSTPDRIDAQGALLIRLYVTALWATAFVGAGLLLSVPATGLLLLYMGYLGRGAPLPAPRPVSAIPPPQPLPRPEGAV